MKTTNYFKFLAVAFAAATLLFTSCAKDTPVNPIPVVKDYAKVMLFHGATDATAVNVQIDGITKNLDSLKYGTSSGYNDVELTGKKITVSGSTAKSGVKIFADSLLMNKGVGYSYFVYQESDAAKTISWFKTVDDLTVPAAGNGRLRLIHLIPDLPAGSAVDVELVATGGVVTNTPGIFTAVKFKDAKNFVDVKVGTYDIKVKTTGTTNLLISAPVSITVVDGKIYTAILRGYSNLVAPRAVALSVINNN
jgi:hypothetical protein